MAEPFKRWLAKVGYERIKEIEDPELASDRTREIYKQKGYSDAWASMADEFGDPIPEPSIIDLFHMQSVLPVKQ